MDKKEIKAFFDRCAANWDQNNEKDSEKIRLILDRAKVDKGKTVLDIACGTGVMFPYYLERGVKKIDGADLSDEMIRIAESKFADKENVHLLCADAETFAFPEEYDCCVVFNAFPHFAHREELLSNLYRALKKGGTLTVAHDWGRKALDRHHRSEAKAVSCGLISEDELAKLFRQCGFSSVNCLADENIYIVSGVKE